MKEKKLKVNIKISLYAYFGLLWPGVNTTVLMIGGNVLYVSLSSPS